MQHLGGKTQSEVQENASWKLSHELRGVPPKRKKSAKQYAASLRWGQGTGNWGTDDLYKPVYDEEDYMQVTFSNKKQNSVCLLRNKIDTSVNSR